MDPAGPRMGSHGLPWILNDPSLARMNSHGRSTGAPGQTGRLKSDIWYSVGASDGALGICIQVTETTCVQDAEKRRHVRPWRQK